MDLNQLYFDHQLSLMRADEADTPCLKYGHRHDAALIAARIGEGQGKLGAAAACAWTRHTLAQPA